MKTRELEIRLAASRIKAALTPVGKIILDQMGGAGRVSAMLGLNGKQYSITSTLHGDGIRIRFPQRNPSKGNVVDIVYNKGQDLYDVTFYKLSGVSMNKIREESGVYSDMLKDMFERQTGLYLRMASIKVENLKKALDEEWDSLGSKAQSKTATSRITDKLLLKTFPELTPVEAAKYAQAFGSTHNTRSAEKLLDQFSSSIGGYGVESLTEQGHYNDVSALYVNRGDTYDATMIYDADVGAFLLQAWGDWVEEAEERGRTMTASAKPIRKQFANRARQNSIVAKFPTSVKSWLRWEN